MYQHKPVYRREPVYHQIDEPVYHHEPVYHEPVHHATPDHLGRVKIQVSTLVSIGNSVMTNVN